jgi:antitoxin HicB
MMLIYPVELTPDDNDTLLVTFPDVPEAVTFGENEAEALLMAEDALLVMFSAYMDDHQPIPEPSRLNGRPGVALKVAASAKIALHNAAVSGRQTENRSGANAEPDRYPGRSFALPLP